jgi:hypothetical protein
VTNYVFESMTAEQAFAAALAEDAPEGEEQEPQGQPEGDPEQPQEQPGEEQAEGVDSSDEPAQPAPEDAIFSSLPDEVRQYVEGIRNRAAELESANQSKEQELARARNDHAAMAGKLRPLQQRLAELERAQRQPAQTPQASEPAQSETVSDLDAFLKTPEWEEYKRTFPSEAAVWEKGQRASLAIAAKLARSEAERAVRDLEGRFAPTITRIETDNARKAHEEAISDLASEHPDWQQINADPRFSQWFDGVYLPQQLDVVQQAFSDENYARRQLANPGFVKKLLHEFKAQHGIQSAATAASAPTTSARSQTPARLAVAAAPTISPSMPRTRMALDRMTPEQAFQAALNSDD